MHFTSLATSKGGVGNNSANSFSLRMLGVVKRMGEISEKSRWWGWSDTEREREKERKKRESRSGVMALTEREEKGHLYKMY